MKTPLRLVLLMITLWFLPNAGRAQDEKPLVHEAIVNAALDQMQSRTNCFPASAGCLLTLLPCLPFLLAQNITLLYLNTG